jgi:hypothetical protein
VLHVGGLLGGCCRICSSYGNSIRLDQAALTALAMEMQERLEAMIPFTTVKVCKCIPRLAVHVPYSVKAGAGRHTAHLLHHTSAYSGDAKVAFTELVSTISI